MNSIDIEVKEHIYINKYYFLTEQLFAKRFLYQHKWLILIDIQ